MQARQRSRCRRVSCCTLRPMQAGNPHSSMLPQKDFERRADPKDRAQAALIEEMRAHTKKVSSAADARPGAGNSSTHIHDIHDTQFASRLQGRNRDPIQGGFEQPQALRTCSNDLLQALCCWL